ncbi:MAG: hypothetical protein Q8P86_00930 [bacterium]|nr:hypothetical protein [bacterium]
MKIGQITVWGLISVLFLQNRLSTAHLPAPVIESESEEAKRIRTK